MMIQGYAVHAAGAELHSYKYDPGELKPHEVRVQVTHCSVAHADVSLIDHVWGISRYPFVPGHEIVGVVAAMGSLVAHLKEGQRVGIGWQADSCGHCSWCLSNRPQLCADAVLTCVGRNGGFAESIQLNARFAVPLPDSLKADTAAPLLTSGGTAYVALRRYGINPSSRVGVLGIGGLGHLVLQFARAFGANVTAFSSSDAKQNDARAFGAHNFVHTRETKGLRALANSFDLIISTGNGDPDWNSYVQALRPQGTLVLAGKPRKPASLNLLPMILGEKQLAGVQTASPGSLVEMLDVAARHDIAARVETYPMAEANAAVAATRKASLRYRAVLVNDRI